MLRLRKDLKFIKKNLIIFLILLGVLVGIGTIAIFSLTDVSLAGNLADLKRQILPGDESSAEVLMEDELIKVKLSIADKDKMQAQQFFEALGADLTDEIKIGVDKQSMDKLAGILPVRMNVGFEGKKLSFGNRSIALLNSSLPSNRYEFATHSAKLVLQANSEKDFKLEVNRPKPLLVYATSSGQLHLSNIVNPLVFDLLDRVDTINLRVNGKNVSGELTLK